MRRKFNMDCGWVDDKISEKCPRHLVPLSVRVKLEATPAHHAFKEER